LIGALPSNDLNSSAISRARSAIPAHLPRCGLGHTAERDILLCEFEKKWRQVLTIPAAEREAGAALENELIVAVKQRMEFGDMLDVDECRSVHAHEIGRIETALNPA